MSAIALSHAEIDDASDADREAKLVTYLGNVYQATLATASVLDRYAVLRDLQAVKSLAKAYRLSDDATRALGETSMRCLRLFGLALRKAYPGESLESMKRRSEATGATVATCQYAAAFAVYSEDDLKCAFQAVREMNLPVGVRYVYAALRGNNPRVRALRLKHGKAVEMMTTGQQQIEGALKMCLSLALRIMEAKEYTYNDAKREYGLSLRTYRRHLARLRAAGLVLDSPMDGRHGIGYVRFITIDTTLADARKAS